MRMRLTRQNQSIDIVIVDTINAIIIDRNHSRNLSTLKIATSSTKVLHKYTIR